MKTTIILTVLLSYYSCISQPQETYSKGNEAFATGKYEDAIKFYTEFILSNPPTKEGWIGKEFLPIYLKRGIAYKEIGDFKKSMQDYNVVIKNDPWNSQPWILRARMKSLLGDYYGAVKDYDVASKMVPDDEVIFIDRGVVKLKMENYMDAIADLDLAIQLNNHNPDAYRIRGYIKIVNGDKKDGCLDLSHAGQMGDMSAYDLIRDYCN